MTLSQVSNVYRFLASELGYVKMKIIERGLEARVEPVAKRRRDGSPE